MLTDRDRLEEGALILLVCVSGGCRHICTGAWSKKNTLRTVGKQSTGQNYYPAQRWCSSIPCLLFVLLLHFSVALSSSNDGAPAKSSPGNKLKMEQKITRVHVCGSVLFPADSLVRTGMKALLYHLRTHFNAPFIFHPLKQF